jgi:hypothetical protein
MATPASSGGGPYVITAVVCENVLEDKDKVLSVIRIVNQINVPNVPTEQLPPMTVTTAPQPVPYATPITTLVTQLSGLITITSGGASGDCAVRVALVRPDGGEVLAAEHTFTLPGVDAVANLILKPLLIPVDQMGLHWFTVSLNGNVVTRTPLQVARMPAESQSLPSGEASQ